MEYFAELGIKKGSLESDIKKAYKKLALKFHPDKYKSKDAHKKFIKIGEAYAELLNSVLKSKQSPKEFNEKNKSTNEQSSKTKHNQDNNSYQKSSGLKQEYTCTNDHFSKSSQTFDSNKANYKFRENSNSNQKSSKPKQELKGGILKFIASATLLVFFAPVFIKIVKETKNIILTISDMIFDSPIAKVLS